MHYVPKAMFFTKGKGIHKEYLTSFELALRDAKISDLNIVSVSSIKPPKCKIVSIQEGRNFLLPGQISFAVMARASTSEPNRLIAASIGLANPAYEDQYGYLSEHHSTGETAQGLATTLRIWLWKCWQLHWDCLVILHLHGTNVKSNGDSLEKYTRHKTLPNQPKGTRMVFGQQ